MAMSKKKGPSAAASRSSSSSSSSDSSSSPSKPPVAARIIRRGGAAPQGSCFVLWDDRHMWYIMIPDNLPPAPEITSTAQRVAAVTPAPPAGGRGNGRVAAAKNAGYVAPSSSSSSSSGDDTYSLVLSPMFDFSERCHMARVQTVSDGNSGRCGVLHETYAHQRQHSYSPSWLINWKTFEAMPITNRSPPVKHLAGQLEVDAMNANVIMVKENRNWFVVDRTTAIVRAQGEYANQWDMTKYIEVTINTGTERGPAKHVDATSVREILRGILPLPPGVINISLSYMGASLRAVQAWLSSQLFHVATGTVGNLSSCRWPSSIPLFADERLQRNDYSSKKWKPDWLATRAPVRFCGSLPSTQWCTSWNYEVCRDVTNAETLVGARIITPILHLVHLPSSGVFKLPFVWLVTCGQTKGVSGGGGGKKKGGKKGGESKDSSDDSNDKKEAVTGVSDVRWSQHHLSSLQVWFSVDGQYLYYPSLHRHDTIIALSAAINAAPHGVGSYPGIDWATLVPSIERVHLPSLLQLVQGKLVHANDSWLCDLRGTCPRALSLIAPASSTSTTATATAAATPTTTDTKDSSTRGSSSSSSSYSLTIIPFEEYYLSSRREVTISLDVPSLHISVIDDTMIGRSPSLLPRYILKRVNDRINADTSLSREHTRTSLQSSSGVITHATTMYATNAFTTMNNGRLVIRGILAVDPTGHIALCLATNGELFIARAPPGYAPNMGMGYLINRSVAAPLRVTCDDAHLIATLAARSADVSAFFLPASYRDRL